MSTPQKVHWNCFFVHCERFSTHYSKRVLRGENSVHVIRNYHLRNYLSPHTFRIRKSEFYSYPVSAIQKKDTDFALRIVSITRSIRGVYHSSRIQRVMSDISTRSFFLYQLYFWSEILDTLNYY